jgi:hypothetical protein
VFTELDINTMAERHNAMYCATDWTGMNTPSIPFAVEVLQNLSLFPKFADRLQQGFVDQLYFGRLMLHPTSTTPSCSGTRTARAGSSAAL